MSLFRLVYIFLVFVCLPKISFATELCGSKTMFFNGSHTSWVAQPMICDEKSDKWILKNVLLTENSLVSFDLKGNWEHTYGGRGGLSGKVSDKYESIFIKQSGRYDIEIDFTGKTYSLKLVDNQYGCVTDTMYVRHSLSPDDAIQMTCDGSRWVKKDLEVSIPGGWLIFDTHGDWVETHGDKNKTGLPKIQSSQFDIVYDARSKDVNIVPGFTPDFELVPLALPTHKVGKAKWCSDAACTAQYERDSSYCRKLRNAKARALCWAAAAAKYGACLAVCD
jgi:hypothetical protein